MSPGLHRTVGTHRAAGEEESHNTDASAGKTEHKTESSNGASGSTGADPVVADLESQQNGYRTKQQSNDVHNEAEDRAGTGNDL